MKRTDGFKQTGKITPNEANALTELHTSMRGKLFRVRDLHGKITLSASMLQRFLWIGRELGLFEYMLPSSGSQAAVYRGCDVDAATILPRYTRKAKTRNRKVEVKVYETNCALANLFGYVPIEHDCEPRLVVNHKGGHIERKRQKVYVGSHWEMML